MDVHDEDRRHAVIEQPTKPHAGETTPPRILARGPGSRADEEGA
ncbi:MAG: hypothetical protein ACYTGV_14350 [Planctomycetota bacterium]